VRDVLDALGELPFNQRAALVMRELEGRSYAEIADTLGVSTAAVETLIFRARRGMRLRASAIRGLAAVPLPSSLGSLLENGAVGGGAILGAGLAAKATIALVAGLVVGGVGYKAVDATFAKSPPARAAQTNAADGNARPWVLAASRILDPAALGHRDLPRATRRRTAEAGGRPPARHRAIRTGDEQTAAPQAVAGRAAGAGSGVPARGAVSEAAAAVQSSAPVPADAPDPVSGVVSTVTGAAPTPSAPLPAPSLPTPPPLPASPPLPPPPPVQLPPPPVQLPPPPPVPPVAPPTVPAPPPLPPIGP
jgi:hypothetical protein